MSLVKKILKLGLLTTISVTSFISCNQVKKEEKKEIYKKEGKIMKEQFEWKYDETKIKEKPVFYSNVVFEKYKLQNNYFTETEFYSFLNLLRNEFETNSNYSKINSKENIDKLIKTLKETFTKDLFKDKFVVYITSPKFVEGKEKDYELVYHDNVNIEFYRLLEKEYYDSLRVNRSNDSNNENNEEIEQGENKVSSLILKNSVSNEEKSKNQIMKFFVFDKKDFIFNNLKITYLNETFDAKTNYIDSDSHAFQLPHYNSIFRDELELREDNSKK
ncbi:hypothetical protein ACR34G_03710 [Mycoplasma sp. 480]|uniref:hypothetical protein n=1 Tax=Mycoplasma sp. 480 TaxID=3440155 RepID=UPI003F50EEFE